mmetsp:Transcript_17886/g.60381  ORF Transcript_17886/g.60381 Transcript_17886/m.60381 type:complete len:280 (+) Transcript_17886:474-1313(+)
MYRDRQRRLVHRDRRRLHRDRRRLYLGRSPLMLLMLRPRPVMHRDRHRYSRVCPRRRRAVQSQKRPEQVDFRRAHVCQQPEARLDRKGDLQAQQLLRLLLHVDVERTLAAIRAFKTDEGKGVLVADEAERLWRAELGKRVVDALRQRSPLGHCRARDADRDDGAEWQQSDPGEEALRLGGRMRVEVEALDAALPQRDGALAGFRGVCRRCLGLRVDESVERDDVDPRGAAVEMPNLEVSRGLPGDPAPPFARAGAVGLHGDGPRAAPGRVVQLVLLHEH